MLTEAELTNNETRALNLLADDTSGDVEVERVFIRALLTGLRVFKDRQRKYGRSNIHESGEEGVRIRTNDKLARLRQASQLGRGNNEVDETIEDTWIDIGNYGFIGVTCKTGTWPAPVSE